MDEARRAGPSLASFNAIKACHMAHFYEDGLCAECMDSFAADAVAQAVARAEGERDALVIERDKIEDRLSVVIDNLRQRVKDEQQLVEALATTDGDQLTRVQEERDALKAAVEERIAAKADQIDALRADLRWAHEEIARLRAEGVSSTGRRGAA